MTSTQVLNLLTAHGCVDITSAIDFTLCSINPKFTGGWGDIFQGRLRTGERVAIKVFRSYGESNELTGKYQKAGTSTLHLFAIHIQNVFSGPHGRSILGRNASTPMSLNSWA
ncbi:hypothetical protein RhiTH_006989 [Rhizoctonia solani]